MSARLNLFPPAPATVAASADNAPLAPTYGRTTRLFHAALASCVVVQLASSFLMVPPMDGAENLAFEIHEYSGLAALTLAFGFWLVVANRRRGTPVALLWPWFSRERRAAVVDDAKGHWAALRERRVPEPQGELPLASAVHGLGLATITAVAATGATFYVALLAGAADSAWAGLDLNVHVLLTKLVWAYLIGHAGVAVLHHVLRQRSLAAMWDLGASEGVSRD